MQLVVGVLISTHVAATALVLDQRSLARPVRWLLVATVPAIGLEICIHSVGLSAPGWIAVGTIGRAAVGAAWLCVGWVTVRRTLAEERRRIISVQQVLASHHPGPARAHARAPQHGGGPRQRLGAARQPGGLPGDTAAACSAR